MLTQFTKIKADSIEILKTENLLQKELIQIIKLGNIWLGKGSPNGVFLHLFDGVMTEASLKDTRDTLEKARDIRNLFKRLSEGTPVWAGTGPKDVSKLCEWPDKNTLIS